MANITRTAKKITGVIQNKNKNIDINSLEKWLAENCIDYSYIVHDKDVDENGDLKNNHIHVVFTLKKAKIRLSTTINNLSNTLICSPFAISLDKADNYPLCLQYLIHRNNPDKYQYDLKDVISNLPFEELSMVLTETSDIINFDVLKTVCVESCGSKLYIMEKIGVGYYSKYRNVISDILAEIGYVETRFRFLK